MIGDATHQRVSSKGFQITQEITTTFGVLTERLVGLGYIKYMMKTHE